MHVDQVARDLAEEQLALDAIVAVLEDRDWQRPTPSEPWTVADQIGHLAYYDQAAVTAITDPPAFQAMVATLWETAAGGSAAVDDLTLARYRAMTPAELLSAWRASRAALSAAAATLEDDTRVSWYGPSMGSRSFLTARLMEAWAHGQDVVDALGVTRHPSDRLRHIAQLGFITRAWSYQNRGLEPPESTVRLELTGPGGHTWEFGPAEADELVIGPALDFCLVVTQRRHLDDTALTTTQGARRWLVLAQAFAGPATDGPDAGTRP